MDQQSGTGQPVQQVSKRPHIGLLIVSALLIVVGFMLIQGDVSCGSQTMQAGDKCVSSTSGKSQTYEEVRQADVAEAIRFGVAAVIVAGLAITIGLFRKPRRPSQSQTGSESAD